MPALALRSSSASLANDSLMVLKFWLIADGIYIWEFFTNLNYEWSFFRGRRHHRWTIWVYFLARLATLGVVILDLVSFNITSEINCQAWAYSIWTCGLMANGSGSLLVLLRIIAIWNRQKVVVALSAAIWATNFAFLISAIVGIRTVWVPLQKACVVTNIEKCKTSLIVLFSADTVLLLIMLAGLLRLRTDGAGTFDLGRLLWKQGCIWFAIAVATELPQTVFVLINVNDVIRMMWVLPSTITMTIASTRMYRSLTNFGSPSNSEIRSENSKRNAFASNFKPPSESALVVRNHSKQLEVTVHTDFEEHQLSQFDTYPGSNGQPAEKSDELRVDSEVESHEGKTRQGVIDIGQSVNP